MAQQVIQTLITELTADGTKMRAEFAQTLKLTNDFSSRMASMIKKTAAVVGAGYTAKALGGLVKDSIDAADALSKTSQIVGVNVESLSKLKYAAELSDVSFESLGTGLKKFSKNIIEASDGTGAQADAFAVLGIKLKNADGSLKSTDQLVGDVADSFSHFEDGAAKTALATELFGKAGADLIPMLNGGRQTLKEAGDEAQRFGLVVTKEAGVAAEEFNDNMTRLEASLTGIANQIAVKVTPSLAEMTSALQDADTQKGLATLGSVLADLIVLSGKSVGTLGKLANFLTGDVSDASDAAAEDVAYLEQQVKNFNKAAQDLQFSPDFDSNSDADEKKLESIYDSARLAAERLLVAKEKLAKKSSGDAWAGIDTLPTGATKGVVMNIEASFAAIESRKAAIKAQQDEQKKLNELVASETKSLQEKLYLSGNITELQRLQYRESYGDLKKLAGFDKERLENLAIEFDRKEKIKELQEQQTKANEERLSLAQLVMTDEQKINEVWDDRIAKMKELATSAEDFEAFQKAANEKRGIELEDALEKSKGKLDEFTKNMYEGMQSTLADSIMSGFDGGAKGLLQSFGHLLQRMAAEAIAADIMRGLFGGALGGGSGPSTMGSLLSGAGKFLGGMFAEGGRPPMGKISVVGDGGEPELFVPDTAGTIVPFSKLGGGGDSFHFGNLVFPGVTNAREAEMAAGAAARKMLSIMGGARRYS